ncbi:hypothetical protein [Streptococcus uberis]|uniref:hypothetical protein n=1 Tax=Streptococcus uberis TaxID=1349 RepID=UPI0012B57E9C|nr:hypothetical protein [Streptococcus uberis]MTB43261.1 hypothetical protein [Streptococcus uberis]
MNLFSNETEQDLKVQIASIVNDAVENLKKPEPRLLGLMTRKQLKEELGISTPTIERFEKNGLKVFQPPFEDSRTKFYRVKDVLTFLGVEG